VAAEPFIEHMRAGAVRDLRLPTEALGPINQFGLSVQSSSMSGLGPQVQILIINR